MAELFAHVDYWTWWIAGVVLLVLEAFAPGAVFLWMGVSAGIVGVAMLLFPGMGWENQLLMFAVFSVASVVLWRRRLMSHPTESDQPTLNRRGHQYVGRTFTLAEPVTNNNGKIRVDDTTWKIRGDDCEAGSKVKVTGVDGVILLVEKIEGE